MNTRRTFLGLAGAGLAWAADDAPEPDLVVFNAKVYTVDSGAPKAEAFAVKAGRFTAVGSYGRNEGACRASALRLSTPSR